jgi:hypothetical protein
LDPYVYDVFDSASAEVLTFTPGTPCIYTYNFACYFYMSVKLRSLTVKREHGLMVLENMALRKIFWPRE